MSHRRHVPSFDSVTARVVSSEKATEWMPLVCPLSSIARAVFSYPPLLSNRTSHIFTSGVNPPQATNRPSGLIVAQLLVICLLSSFSSTSPLTLHSTRVVSAYAPRTKRPLRATCRESISAECARGNSRASFTVAASTYSFFSLFFPSLYTRTTPLSASATRMYCESGLNATHEAWSVSRLMRTDRWFASANDDVYHKRTVRSTETDARKRPSKLKSMDLTASVCPLSTAYSRGCFSFFAMAFALPFGASAFFFSLFFSCGTPGLTAFAPLFTLFCGSTFASFDDRRHRKKMPMAAAPASVARAKGNADDSSWVDMVTTVRLRI
eukprot:Opistho-2@96719